MPARRFYSQPKIYKSGVPIPSIISYSGSPLYNLNKYIDNILKAYIKDGNDIVKNSTTFSTTSEMFPLKMTRKWCHLTSLPCTRTFL